MRLQAPVVVPLVLALLSCTGDRYSLSDNEAGRVIEQKWLTAPDTYEIWVGKLAVLTPSRYVSGASREKDEVDPQAPEYYRKLEGLGLLQIRGFRDYTKNFGGWDSFLVLTQQGHGAEFEAIPSAEGEKYKCPPSWYRRSMCIPVGKASLGRIVRNDLIKKEPSTYRIILAEYKFAPNDLYTKVSKAQAEAYKRPLRPTYTDGKVEALLSYDEFKKSWVVSAITYASAKDSIDDAPIRTILNK